MNTDALLLSRRCVAAAALLLAFSAVPSRRAAAADPGAWAAVALQRQALTLEAGQTYVIDHVKIGSIPELSVVENPHALVTHGERPGKFVLMGAERGRWQIKVQRDDGTSVVYDVTVVAVRDPNNPLKGEPAPPAMSDRDDGDSAAQPADSDQDVPDTDVVSEETPAAAQDKSDPQTNHPPAQNPSAPQSAPAQTVSVTAAPGVFRADPTLAGSGGAYQSPSVSGGPNYLPSDSVWVMAGTSQVIDFRHRMKRISIADSAIADVQVVTPFQLNLIGHKPGFTTIAVWDEQGNYEQREIRVASGKKQQVLLNTVVAELNRTTLENQGINYSVALRNYNVSLVGLPGLVATPYTAQSTAAGTTPILVPGGTIMPLLLSQNITYGLSANNSNVNTQTLFQYLEEHNLARILARPQLLANSGEKAKFLSGGEIPIVIAQALNTTIVFKQFGVSVQFVPTLVGSRDIELLVKPEVSQPDYAHGVELFGFQVPAFVTRRAETVVRLRDTQTLIIAGLILHDKREVIQKVPYLGDVPYLGGLFRNTTWQDQESDLVMAVTPQIVTPLPAGGQVFVPSQRAPLSPRDIKTQRTSTPDAGRPRF